MKRRFTLFIFLILAGLNKISAQTYPRPEIQVEDFVEKLFNLQGSDASYEDLYEQLLLLYSNPIDLNDAGPDELRNTYILSEQQVQQFCFIGSAMENYFPFMSCSLFHPSTFKPFKHFYPLPLFRKHPKIRTIGGFSNEFWKKKTTA